MQWNGVRPNPDRPAPLRSLMEILQQKAEPYVTQYGENQLPGAGQLLNSIVRTGTEMVPGVGDLLGAEDLQTAAQNNDWAGIGLGALAAIPGIPAIGRGVRSEARAARGVANTVADAVPTNQPMTEAEAALARYRAVNPNDTGARVLSPGDQGYPTNAQWDEASQAYVAPVEIRGGEIYRGDTRVGRVRLSETGGSLSIDDIEISPSLRSQGIGSDVIRQIQERARQEGRPLTLTSDAMRGTDAQQRQRSLYERLGFQPNSGPNRVSERIGSRNVSPEYVWRGEPVAPVEPDYPIRAYHGSPHSFDRFSLDKIGTGEGAQAYGHGLYFAENEGVARSYRDQLSNWTADGKGLGKKLSMDLGAFGGDLDALMASRMEQLANWTAQDPNHFITRDLQRDVAELEALKAKTLGSSGSMYEVGINADPSTFLDWDRPLSEQPAMMERFRSDAAEPLFGRIPWGDRQIAAPSPDQTPWQVIKEYEDLRGPAGVREALQNLGINGIRYLDGNSRYAPDTLPDNPISNEARQWLDIAQGDSAEALRQFNASNPIERFAGPERDEVRKVIQAAARRPTSNYVVFNDELVKILRKYGISGLSTTVGASALAEELDRRGQAQEF